MQNLRSDRLLGWAALAALIIGCFLVLRPFLTALLWAAILATIGWPAFRHVDRLVGGRRVLAALLMTSLVTLVLLGPFVLVAVSLADSVAQLGDAVMETFRSGLPDPPGWLAGIPWVGDRLHAYWQDFAHDGQRLAEALRQAVDLTKGMLLGWGKALGVGVLELGLSVFLGFFFFRDGEILAAELRAALARLAGAQAQQLLRIAAGTVEGVVFGILGTALAQGILAGIGFAVAGVPGALLLGLATFFLSAAPVGPPLVWISAAFWLFQQGSPGWALFVALWGLLVVSTVDNIIKPLIISRGSSLPFALVFLGVLGGVLAFGLIGVFLGPVLVAVAYRLVTEWLSGGLADSPE